MSLDTDFDSAFEMKLHSFVMECMLVPTGDVIENPLSAMFCWLWEKPR